MGFLKQLVIGRWKAAVQQEGEAAAGTGKSAREGGGPAERATAAAAAGRGTASTGALTVHTNVQELTRERGALRDAHVGRSDLLPYKRRYSSMLE